jgi:hypothetical protein
MEVPTFVGMTEIGWCQEIPASAGIAMWDCLINHAVLSSFFFFRYFFEYNFDE